MDTWAHTEKTVELYIDYFLGEEFKHEKLKWADTIPANIFWHTYSLQSFLYFLYF